MASTRTAIDDPFFPPSPPFPLVSEPQRAATVTGVLTGFFFFLMIARRQQGPGFLIAAFLFPPLFPPPFPLSSSSGKVAISTALLFSSSFLLPL